jgi:hypothetical protein
MPAARREGPVVLLVQQPADRNDRPAESFAAWLDALAGKLARR